MYYNDTSITKAHLGREQLSYSIPRFEEVSPSSARCRPPKEQKNANRGAVMHPHRPVSFLAPRGPRPFPNRSWLAFGKRACTIGSRGYLRLARRPSMSEERANKSQGGRGTEFQEGPCQLVQGWPRERSSAGRPFGARLSWADRLPITQ